jgi:hypothetical protein
MDLEGAKRSVLASVEIQPKMTVCRLSFYTSPALASPPSVSRCSRTFEVFLYCLYIGVSKRFTVTPRGFLYSHSRLQMSLFTHDVSKAPKTDNPGRPG